MKSYKLSSSFDDMTRLETRFFLFSLYVITWYGTVPTGRLD